jgi:chromosome condensin MukBEF complex kleisin-like MukF subunit
VSHTYAILDVTSETFREIQNKLEAAGYQHAFKEDAQGQLLIDLHGVAIRDEEGDEGPYEPEIGSPI